MRFEEWLSRLRSAGTRRVYRGHLERFSAWSKTTPEGMLEWTLEETERTLEEYKYYMLGKGYSGTTIYSNFTGIRRWFRDHRIRVFVDLRDLDTGRTYLDYIPTRKDVQTLLDDAKLPQMVMISLIAFAGLRPVDVANLRYENFKVSYERGEPVLTIVIKQRKTSDWFFTFLGPQGKRYLQAYIEQHGISEGPILGTSAGAVCKSIERIIIRTKGKRPTGESFRVFRVYGLRKYFRRTISQLGESVAEFLMGHRAGIESLVATYSGLRDMDPTAIESLKQQYIEILNELETEITDVSLKRELEEKQDKIRAFEERLEQLERKIDSLD